MEELDNIRIYTIIFAFIEKISVTGGDETKIGLALRVLTATSEEQSLKRKIRICRKELESLVNEFKSISDASSPFYETLRPILDAYNRSSLRKAKFSLRQDYEEIFKIFEALRTYIRKTEGPSASIILDLIENKLN